MSKQTKPPASPVVDADSRRARREARQEQLRREREQVNRSKRIRMLGLGAAGAVILAGVLYLIISAAFAPRPPALGTAIPIQGRDHINPGQGHPPYNSTPATSGWHYPTTAEWGVHDEFVPEELAVHNLEHGGIVIRYYCPNGCKELASQLSGLVNRYRSKVLLSPYNKPMEHRIALTAWGWLDSFDEFDEGRIVAFIDRHKNQGPEQVPD